MNSTALFFGVLWGSIGFGYFLYGKKQRKTVPLICGMMLMIFPYFIDRPLLLGFIGLGISLVPYFLRE